MQMHHDLYICIIYILVNAPFYILSWSCTYKRLATFAPLWFIRKNLLLYEIVEA